MLRSLNNLQNDKKEFYHFSVMMFSLSGLVESLHICHGHTGMTWAKFDDLLIMGPCPLWIPSNLLWASKSITALIDKTLEFLTPSFDASFFSLLQSHLLFLLYSC